MHEHDHIHHHHHSTDNIKLAFFLNLVFTIIEIIGGICTNSVAIVTDAVHDLGDTITIGFSWYLEKVSKKKRTKEYSYGYTRFSLLAAIININVLVLGSIFVLKESITRLMNPEPCNVKGMMLLGVLGVIFNGAAVLKLKKGHSENERVVMLHLMEDVLGWVAILIGAIVMYFVDVPILDPILSISIACYILYGASKNLKRTLSIFLQGVPKGVEMDTVVSMIKEEVNVLEVHDVHLWSLDGDYNVLTAHVIVPENTTMRQLACLKKDIHAKLKEYKIPHATLEFELHEESCHLEEH
jgi:cobalt-zinc-cadmium efflux system protein